MKQRGGVGKAGEVIPYVFCLGADGKSAKSAQADHAFHPDEFRRKDSGLKIGKFAGKTVVATTSQAYPLCY